MCLCPAPAAERCLSSNAALCVPPVQEQSGIAALGHGQDGHATTTDMPEPASSNSPTPTNSKQIYLSLGSNRGDRALNLQRAIEALEGAGVRVQRASSLYKTEPVDFGPQEWFLNCAVEAQTYLMPRQLLRALKSVERALGRRPGVHKGPRPIDIDILLYENVVVRTTELTIPHERLAQRRFVLVPLRELAPTARDPVSKRTVAELLQGLTDASQVVKYRSEDRTIGPSGDRSIGSLNHRIVGKPMGRWKDDPMGR